MIPVLDQINLDVLFLDMDGTLLDLAFDNYFWQVHLPAALAANRDWTFADSFEHIKQHSDKVCGTREWYCFDHWSHYLGLDLSLCQWEIADRIAFRDGALPFLKHLKQLPINTVLLTNSDPTGLSMKLKTLGFAPYFDHCISTHEIGLAKEQQGFWTALQKRIRFAPTESALVDDSQAVLENARQSGIKQCFGVAKPDMSLDRLVSNGFPQIEQFHHFLGLDSW